MGNMDWRVIPPVSAPEETAKNPAPLSRSRYERRIAMRPEAEPVQEIIREPVNEFETDLGQGWRELSKPTMDYSQAAPESFLRDFQSNPDDPTYRHMARNMGIDPDGLKRWSDKAAAQNKVESFGEVVSKMTGLLDDNIALSAKSIGNDIYDRFNFELNDFMPKADELMQHVKLNPADADARKLMQDNGISYSDLLIKDRTYLDKRTVLAEKLQAQARNDDPRYQARLLETRRLRNYIGEETPNAVKNDPWSAKGITGNVIGAVGQMAPHIAASVVTKSGAGLYSMGADAYGRELSEGEEKGLTPEQNRQRAGVLASSVAATSGLPLKVILNGRSGKLLKDVVAAGVAEGSQEVVEEAIKMGYDKGFLDEDISVEEAVGRASYAFLIGGLTGASIKTVMSSFQGMSEEAQQEMEKAVENKDSQAAQAILNNSSEESPADIAEQNDKVDTFVNATEVKQTELDAEETTVENETVVESADQGSVASVEENATGEAANDYLYRRDGTPYPTEKTANRGGSSRVKSGKIEAYKLQEVEGGYAVVPATKEAASEVKSESETITAEAPETKVSKGDVLAEAATEKIEDVGEVLQGARKHTAALREVLAEEIDVAELPLSKSFPQPNYDKLKESNAAPETMAFVSFLRSGIKPKPRKAGALARWKDTVSDARDISQRLLSGELKTAEAVKQLAKTSDYGPHLLDVFSLAKDIEPKQIQALGNYRISNPTFSMYNGVKGDTKKWVVRNVKSKRAQEKIVDTKGEALQYIKDQISETSTEGRETKFDLWFNRVSGKYTIGKKLGARKYIELESFDGISEARTHLADNQAKLEEQLVQKKKVGSHRRAEQNERIGKDYRKNKNVKTDDFANYFGFRGVQFGNYVENDRRQQDVNNAYDGLRDLAQALKIPDKAISLNGELGLAFGARGSGGKNAAKAHYEPGDEVTQDNVIINLTKNNGPGSLAHEWWHALDNYFARMGGLTSDKKRDGAYLTELKRPKYGLREEGYRELDPNDFGVRPEVYDAFKSISQTIEAKTDLIKRAGILDGRRTKNYWASMRELTARSFEKYLIDRLAKGGNESDYLATILDQKSWDATETFFGNTQESYPYPTDQEAKILNSAFDALFNKLKTKQTDQGVALFSVKGDKPARSKTERVEYRQALRKGLDMSEKARMARAVEQGYITDLEEVIHGQIEKGKVRLYDKAEGGNTGNTRRSGRVHVPRRFYHGTKDNIKAFDRNHPGAKDAGFLGRGIYLATDPELAHAYAENKQGEGKPKVMSLLLRGKRFVRSDTHFRALMKKAAFKDQAFIDRMTERLKSQGIDGVINDDVEGATELVVFDENKIRSVNASFDPELTFSKNLLLSVGPASSRKGIVLGAAQSVADRFVEAFPSLDITVVKQESQLPSTVVKQIQAKGLQGRIEGVWSGDAFYLVAENLNGRTRAQEVLLHEVKGHHGVEKVLGADVEKVMREVFKSFPQTEFSDTAKRQRLDINDPADQITLAKEKIAEMAESGQKPGLVKRFIAAVRRALRRLGFVNRWMDSDILGLLEASESYLSQPEELSTLQAAFSVRQAPIFYSEMYRVLSGDGVIPAKAKARSMKQQIRALQKKGFKSEELEWSGMEGWLDSFGDKTVTRKQVFEYLRANLLQVDEIGLSKDELEPASQRQVDAAQLDYDTELAEEKSTLKRFATRLTELKYDESRHDDLADFFRGFIVDKSVQEAGIKLQAEDGFDWDSVRAREVAVKVAKETLLETKARAKAWKPRWDSYVYPQAENYRELLITLPRPGLAKTRTYQREYIPLIKQRDALLKKDNLSAVEQEQLEDIVSELSMLEPDMLQEQASLPGGKPFFTSHYEDIPNILAHVRFSERKGKDGSRILFLDEVQSDWHQEGRRKGYKVTEKNIETLRRKVTDIQSEMQGMKLLAMNGKILDQSIEVDGEWGEITLAEATKEQAKVITKFNNVMDEYGETLRGNNKRVPDAPFKTSWPELVFKRVSRIAVEDGYDAIAWSTGDMQANLYDLTRVLKAIHYRKAPHLGDNIYDIDTIGIDGKVVVDASGRLTPEQIKSKLGKDVADEIVRNEAGEGVLEGDGLKFDSGAGMRGFYDDMLPKKAAKLFRKWGSKVGTTEIDFISLDNAETETIAVNHLPLTDRVKAVVEQGLPLFSVRQLPTDIESAIKHGGFSGAKQTSFKEKYSDFKRNAGLKFRQGAVDQFASIKHVLNNQRAWMMAHLTKSHTGAVEAVILHGTVELKDGAIAVNTDKPGLKDVLSQLGGEVDYFLQWIAGNRAARLKADGKENRFSDEYIKALKRLNQGTMPDGSSRVALYEKARKEFEVLQASVTDVAVKAHLIGAKEAAVWRQEGFYVPFYRVLEDGESRGPRTFGGGLANNTAYKKLKGADLEIDDLLSNILLNWNHLLSASLNNQAAVNAMASAVDLGFAEQKTDKTKSKHAINVHINGKKRWFDIDDTPEGKLIIDALMSLNFDGMNHPIMRGLRWFKRTYTVGVTASPGFRVANLMKDSIMAMAVTDMSTNTAKNLVQGWKATSAEDGAYVQMLAGGGAFGESGYIHGSDPVAIKKIMRGEAEPDSVIKNPLDIGKIAWRGYQKFGSRLENVNRAANFKQNKNDGMDLLTANFNARDHLDFSRTGTWIAVRALAQVVPFLNSRMQGVDKFYRAAQDPKQQKQMLAVMGLYSIASVLLYLAMKDDEDYKALNQWERDLYHHFKIGDRMWKIPRPFEVGAIASVAERAAGLIAEDNTSLAGDQFLSTVGHVIFDTLAFNPVPQGIKPLGEAYLNYNTFTGRAIESQGQLRKSPENRKKSWTSATAVKAGEATGLSPLKIEHLVNGYFGWLGTQSLAFLDLGARPLTGAPGRPDMNLDQVWVAKRFSKSLPAKSTRYIGAFYDSLNDMNAIHADINAYKLAKEHDRVKEARANNKLALRWRKQFNRTARDITDLNKQIESAYNSKRDSTRKRVKLDRLYVRKNNIVKRLMVRYEQQLD